MDAGAEPSERFMLYGPERVFYAGLLGRPRRRTSGGLTLYAAMQGDLELTIEGEPTRWVPAALVQPNTVHSMSSAHPAVACVVIEPETIDRTVLRQLIAATEAGCQHHLARRIRQSYAAFRQSAGATDVSTADFDTQLFGAPLKRRTIDPRIARILDEMALTPGAPLPASRCAEQVGLSVSRFLHLFKEETDAPFRALRAWKRARHFLNFANEASNMAHLALDIGYPDSTHFSHSIRRFYGLKPRAIFSGSRELAIYRSPAVVADRA